MAESVSVEMGPSRASSLFFNETSYLPHEIDWSYVNQDWPPDSSQATHQDAGVTTGSGTASSWTHGADALFWPSTPQRMEGLRSPQPKAAMSAIDVGHDSSLFSSSLPVLFKSQLTISDSGSYVATPNMNGAEEEVFGSLEEMESNTIGSLLPGDEEELLSGVQVHLQAQDFDVLPYTAEDYEDDLFSSGGGLELEGDGDAFHSYGSAGEHPHGEHPSRTLFVRNINSNVEDSELRSLFELYGDIRTLYTACKHRGFVMISYYDIRAARLAMRTLQGKSLRRRKLDIHFSIPKDNPSDKDMNQGTLVVFNLDASVTNDDLREKFGEYGEIKEIRETPHKKHHKFVEFYDIRSADAALRALNRSDLAGKRIKLEPSRPGGVRRSNFQHLGQEHDQEDGYTGWNGSPPGFSAESKMLDSDTLFASPTASFRSFSPRVTSQLQEIASPVRTEHFPLRNHVLESQGHSLPEYLNNPQFFKSSGTGSFRHVEGFEARTLPRPNGTFPDPYQSPGSSALQRSSSLSASLTGQLWGAGPYSQAAKSSSSIWQNSHSPGHSFNQRSAETHNSLYSSSFSSHTNHFGSYTREQSYPDSPEPSPYVHSGSYGRSQSTSDHGPSSPNFGMFLPPRLFGNVGGGGGSLDDRRTRRMDNTAAALQSAENKKQFQLDLDRIISGDDTRTTLMIKNIPNKYTSKMLLAAIDESHRGTYDFIYLPIDFKNKCNVGYAFINMLSPTMIPAFYKTFNGKKWEKFNSEKVASLAYARIQGKSALIAHFQNSSLMNEDKRCRPIIFHSEGPNVGDQEPFPVGENVRSRTSAYYKAESLLEDHLAHFGDGGFGGFSVE